MNVTDKDMSKDLRDAGLDLETANMVWVPFGCPQNKIAIPREYADLYGYAYTNMDLCWDLGAILEMIPHSDTEHFTLSNEPGDWWIASWDNGTDACRYRSGVKLIAVVRVLLWILFLEKECQVKAG